MAEEHQVRQVAGVDEARCGALRKAEARWRQVFPGEGRQLAVVRQWLKTFLPDCTARDDVISVTTELASNAVLHTGSGNGGCFCVEICDLPGLVRVAVADGGALTEPRLVDDPAGEHGRGLQLVTAMSARRGMRAGPRGRVVWADVPWDGARPAAPAPSGDAETVAVLAALADLFPAVPTWFGASTAQWWALADSELITASSPQELAGLITRALFPPDAAVPAAREHPLPAREGA
jgi:anti-sigma regulatory factor (Ser/Thr protein kinase)